LEQAAQGAKATVTCGNSTRQSEDGPYAVAVSHLPGAAPFSLHPPREVPDPDAVLDRNARHRHPDRGQAVGNASNPFMAAQCRQPEGDRLVERRGRDLNGVADALQVGYRDATGPN